MLLQLFLIVKWPGILFSTACLVYLFIGNSAALKRKLLLPFCVVSSIWIVGTGYFTLGIFAALIAAVFAVFVSLFFIRHLIICDACGRIGNSYRGGVPKACPCSDAA